MRIVSGKYRGKKLLSPRDDKIRPTTDMVKENIFNSIQAKVSGSRFLDLFAGSGAIGIEAVSRGASEVAFCDIDRDSVSLIKSNLASISSDARVILGDYRHAIKELASRQFDIIYLDPPYGSISLEDIIASIDDEKLLANNGIIVWESDTSHKSQTVPKGYAISKSKRYGKVTIDIIEKKLLIGLVTGCFDPVTIGHTDIIDRAYKCVDRLIVCIMNNPDKSSMFGLTDRLNMLRLAMKGREIIIDSYDGMCYQYCIDKGVGVIYRGYRDAVDKKYEQEMSKYNWSQSGVDTILLMAKKEYRHISSGQVREFITTNQSLEGLLPGCVIEYIKSIKEN